MWAPLWSVLVLTLVCWGAYVTYGAISDSPKGGDSRMSLTTGGIVCRLCMGTIKVHFTRTGQDTADWVGLVASKAPLIAHMNTCQPGGAQVPMGARFVLAPQVSKGDLEARINTILNVADPYGGRHFVAKGGSRACTMCGRLGEECLSQLTSQARANPGKGGTPCCGACANGNTHPAPLEAFGMCSEWGAEYGVGGPRYQGGPR